jgi:hypothetical protein
MIAVITFVTKINIRFIGSTEANFALLLIVILFYGKFTYSKGLFYLRHLLSSKSDESDS